MQLITSDASWIRRRLRALEDESGFSLVELLIACLVFGIIASGTLVTMGSTLNLSRGNRNRSIAANLASAEMDEVRSMDFDDVPLGQTTSVATADNGVDYTITQDAQWVPMDSTSGSCEAPLLDTEPAVLRVSVSVAWPNMSGVQPVESQTVLSPPVGVYDPAKGHVGVKVVDRNGAPASGHMVTLVGGGSTQTLTTTSDGCAFFGYLTPGSYTVSLDSAGYVDGQGLANPSQVAAVHQGQTTSSSFTYDRAATLDVAFSALSGYGIPNGLGVTIANTGLQLGVERFDTPGNTASLTGLFPFPSGYFVWAGKCMDADPEGQKPQNGGPYFAGGIRAPAVQIDPGTTSSATVPLRSLDVLVMDDDGEPHGGKTVTATHVALFGADDGCPSGQNLTLGTTDAQGMLRTSLPYGYWELRVTNEQPDLSWPVVELTPDEADPDGVTVEIED